MTSRAESAAVAGYAVVTGQTYTMTAADFADGCYTVTDAATGLTIGIGEHKLGYHVRTILNVPLCEGCDAPVPDDGVCHGCRQIHGDIADIWTADTSLTECLPDPLKGIAA
jgi:hypothetical protein